MRSERSWFFAVDPRAARGYVRQIIWAGGGFALMTFFAGSSYTRFRHRSPYPYAAGTAVLSEQWGFAGGFLACLLLLVVLLRGVRITCCARDEYGRYVGAGIVGMMCFHGFVNVGRAPAARLSGPA